MCSISLAAHKSQSNDPRPLLIRQKRNKEEKGLHTIIPNLNITTIIPPPPYTNQKTSFSHPESFRIPITPSKFHAIGLYTPFGSN